MKKGYIFVGSDTGPIMETSVADSYFSRLRGLIGRNPETFGPLWIKPCRQIHTCMMSAPIDVLYVSKSGRIVKCDEAVAPGRFCGYVKEAETVLELPAGEIRRYGFRENSVLRLVYM